MPTTIFHKSGGYEQLLSFRKATIIYDGTVRFTDRYLRRGDRTVDQMIQAARSGKQNIAEGNLAAATSTETEIKLTNVARASLGELLIDYQDFARLHNIPIWERNHPLKQRLIDLNRDRNANYDTFRRAIEHEQTEIVVNTMVFLIEMAMYLLDRNLQTMERNFLQQGGIRERMSTARREYRDNRRDKGQ